VYWCAGAVLFTLGIFILTLAILQAGDNEKIRNRRIGELRWQSKNRNTDWWLDINKKKD
jgi:hypothetical protein